VVWDVDCAVTTQSIASWHGAGTALRLSRLVQAIGQPTEKGRFGRVGRVGRGVGRGEYPGRGGAARGTRGERLRIGRPFTAVPAHTTRESASACACAADAGRWQPLTHTHPSTPTQTPNGQSRREASEACDADAHRSVTPVALALDHPSQLG
jgi:hypothetical protein